MTRRAGEAWGGWRGAAALVLFLIALLGGPFAHAGGAHDGGPGPLALTTSCAVDAHPDGCAACDLARDLASLRPAAQAGPRWSSSSIDIAPARDVPASAVLGPRRCRGPPAG